MTGRFVQSPSNLFLIFFKGPNLSKQRWYAIPPMNMWNIPQHVWSPAVFLLPMVTRHEDFVLAALPSVSLIMSNTHSNRPTPDGFFLSQQRVFSFVLNEKHVCGCRDVLTWKDGRRTAPKVLTWSKATSGYRRHTPVLQSRLILLVWLFKHHIYQNSGVTWRLTFCIVQIPEIISSMWIFFFFVLKVEIFIVGSL